MIKIGNTIRIEMKKVLCLYKPSCPFSQSALRYLQENYDSKDLCLIDVTTMREAFLAFQKQMQVDAVTVPQIYIYGAYIGGWNELKDKKLNSNR